VVNTVAGAPEALLERNAFYTGLKKLATDRATEIDGLKDTIRQRDQEIESQDKELGMLKTRCETLEYVCSTHIPHICSLLLTPLVQRDRRPVC
jgi:hypothetical protein